MAERVGFEPTLPCGKHAFQACAFSHSATSPVQSAAYAEMLEKKLTRHSREWIASPSLRENSAICITFHPRLSLTNRWNLSGWHGKLQTKANWKTAGCGWVKRDRTEIPRQTRHTVIHRSGSNAHQLSVEVFGTTGEIRNMSFQANVLKVMIASPEEAAEERKIVTGAIYRWNDANAAARRLVLLPIKWETDSTPQARSSCSHCHQSPTP